MPVYLFWGEDGYRRDQAAIQLRERVVAPAWSDFNFQRFGTDALIDALNLAVTLPFGSGGRLVVVEEAQVFSQCPEGVATELARTLSCIPPTNHLLFTLTSKPDGRLKSSKLVSKLAEVREFSLIAPWQEAKLKAQVSEMAEAHGLRLSSPLVQLLAEAVGNDTRRLDSELTKLALYAESCPLDAEAVSALVSASASTSFALAGLVLAGRSSGAVAIIDELLRRNEPALRIAAVLTSQFRTWLLVRVAVEAGEREAAAIARIAEISNPSRVYFLQKEVERTAARQLSAALPILLELEMQLKTGKPERAALQNAALQMASIFAARR